MKKRNLTLLIVWIALMGISLALTFRTYILQEDFKVLAITACDPEKETCFVYHCDSENPDNAVDMCAQVEDKTTLYYTYILKKKSLTPSCDAREENCEPLTCETGEEGCGKVICSDQSLQDEFVPEGAECRIFVPVPAPEPVVETPVEEPVIQPAPIEPMPIDVEPQPGIILDDPTPLPAPAPGNSSPVVLPGSGTSSGSEPYDPSTDTSL